MPRSLAEVLKRRVVPRAAVIVSQISWPARVGATARRRLGRRGCVELFFSFDDPCSAIAVIDLADRLAGRDVRLVLRPVLRRGIADDPAVTQKRRYAIDDARRLGRRLGLTLAGPGPDRRRRAGAVRGGAGALRVTEPGVNRGGYSNFGVLVHRPRTRTPKIYFAAPASMGAGL